MQAYIAPMPGWKRDAGARLDGLIVQDVPEVEKAVKWNSPFYGAPGKGWFLSFHSFTPYIKVAFFEGADLRPMPPVASNDPKARYLHILEADHFETEQLSKWVRDAAAGEGWVSGR